jgi:uncharacterized protein (TIGR03083 family)
MARTDVWPLIHAERQALASDLASLSDQRWSVASLCDEWTVRDVLAHLTAMAKTTPASFFPKLLGSRLSITRMQRKDIATERGASPEDGLSRFREVTGSIKHAGPIEATVGETIVHAEDIRRPLGIKHTYPNEAAVRVANFYKGWNLVTLVVGTKRRIAGLTLRATDTDWSHGSGPEISGPIMSLVMAMFGRKASLEDLDGDGLDTLRRRP